MLKLTRQSAGAKTCAICKDVERDEHGAVTVRVSKLCVDGEQREQRGAGVGGGAKGMVQYVCVPCGAARSPRCRSEGSEVHRRGGNRPRFRHRP